MSQNPIHVSKSYTISENPQYNFWKSTIQFLKIHNAISENPQYNFWKPNTINDFNNPIQFLKIQYNFWKSNFKNPIHVWNSYTFSTILYMSKYPMQFLKIHNKKLLLKTQYNFWKSNLQFQKLNSYTCLKILYIFNNPIHHSTILYITQKSYTIFTSSVKNGRFFFILEPVIQWSKKEM